MTVPAPAPLPLPLPLPAPAPVLPPPPADLDIPAIRSSFASMTAGARLCAGDFYGYLFAGHPGLRSMFPPVMGMQNERLFSALVKIVSLMDAPDQLARYLTQLGADHRKYGVQPGHYAAVGEALLRALRRHCPAWDDRAEAAWAGAYAVAADTMIAGAETSSGPAFWRGRVVRHEMRTRDLAVIDIETDGELPFEPGQYITVQHEKWPRVWRQFSVANAPACGGRLIQLHVRQVPGGWVSTALTRDTTLADELIIGPPAGSMTAESASGRDLLLVAGGTGLAPLKALAEDVLARDESAMSGGWGARRRITLFHGARTPFDLYDSPALHDLRDTYPWLSVVPVVSGEEDFGGLTGPVADVMLGYGDWASREAYLAGPPEMICRAARGLRDAGTPESQVHFDQPGGG